jgi:peptide/nickel transport system substrate-binding protein
MRTKTVLFAILATILVLSLVLSGCKSSTTTTPAKTSTTTTTTPAQTSTAPTPTPTVTTPAVQKGGILTIISNNVPTTWGYPVKAGAGFAPIFASLPVFEGFLYADLHGNLLPKLALSWTNAADLSSITFKLRQGVKFHDGTSFNAQVAKWNLDLFLARGTGSPADWKSVEIVDDYTVRINLKSYKNTQLSNMTYGMISQAAVEKNGIDFTTTNPVGTGPFKFKSFVPNTSLEYTRFDDYWGNKANVDGIKNIYIVDSTTAGMAFKAGDGLVWEGGDPKTAADLVKTGYLKSSRRGPIMNLVPDSANPDSPFAKKEVREAIEYAINKQAIVDTFGYGSYETVYQPNVPEQFGHTDGLIERKYDPAKAKQLLAAAGYPTGFSTKIITSSALAKDPLVAIQADLDAVGIKVTIEVQDAAKWAQTRTTGWNNGLFYLTHGATDYNYCAYLERYYTPNSGFMAKSMALPDGWVDFITKMMLTSDQTQMASLAKQAVKIEVDNEMEIPLWVEAAVYITSKNVHDMGVGTFGDGFSWSITKVWISK